MGHLWLATIAMIKLTYSAIEYWIAGSPSQISVYAIKQTERDQCTLIEQSIYKIFDSI